MITSLVNIHCGYGPPPKVDAYVDADGFVTMKRTQSSEDATVAVSVALHGQPDAVLADLDRQRQAVLDAIEADGFACSADAARETALAYSDCGF